MHTHVISEKSLIAFWLPYFVCLKIHKGKEQAEAIPEAMEHADDGVGFRFVGYFTKQ